MAALTTCCLADWPAAKEDFGLPQDKLASLLTGHSAIHQTLPEHHVLPGSMAWLGSPGWCAKCSTTQVLFDSQAFLNALGTWPYLQDVASLIPRVGWLIGNVPGQDGGVIPVQHTCDAILAQNDGGYEVKIGSLQRSQGQASDRLRSTATAAPLLQHSLPGRPGEQPEGPCPKGTQA